MPRASQKAGPKTLCPYMAAPIKEKAPKIVQNQPNIFMIQLPF